MGGCEDGLIGCGARDEGRVLCARLVGWGCYVVPPLTLGGK